MEIIRGLPKALIKAGFRRATRAADGGGEPVDFGWSAGRTQGCRGDPTEADRDRCRLSWRGRIFPHSIIAWLPGEPADTISCHCDGSQAARWKGGLVRGARAAATGPQRRGISHEARGDRP